MYIRAGDYVYTCGKVVRQECWGECWEGYCSIALQMLLWGGGHGRMREK